MPISTHAPRTGSDALEVYGWRIGDGISTHAPRTGSDAAKCRLPARPRHFNPRSPHGERQSTTLLFLEEADHFNPRSPHGERQDYVDEQDAKLEEFQPTLPARGATWANYWYDKLQNIFQPTLPARGATCWHAGTGQPENDFNPRSPHGERHVRCKPERLCARISTHAPRTGSDTQTPSTGSLSSVFQPTLPARGATKRGCGKHSTIMISTHAPRTGSDCAGYLKKVNYKEISTHAPRTGSDNQRFGSLIALYHFNPRSPHGERPKGRKCKMSENLFQPTLPARGATAEGTSHHVNGGISTHAPRTGSDRSEAGRESASTHFNPRSPHGERRTRLQSPMERINHFNPRSPHGERPRGRVRALPHFRISTHAPRTGSDTRQYPDCH